MSFSKLIIFLLGVVCLPCSALAQQPKAPVEPARPGAIGIEEATALTQGWALLAQGLTNEAAARAAQVLATYPTSAAAMMLAVEAEIARGGGHAGLDQYERWLGGRALDEPSTVRRVAIALLHEVAADGQKDAAHLEALRVLADDGDSEAAAELSAASTSGSPPELRALAATGNASAVKALISQLNSGGSNVLATLEALAQSGSALAIAPLADRLQDQAPEIRGAAVEGLGTLASQHDIIDRIKPALDDKSGYVRIKAAAALFRLGDMSGATMLQELWTAESEKSRLIAAQAMASQPDALWMDQVRRLTSAGEPEVRIGAARLIAPYDPQLARQIIDSGMADSNPAIRNMAAESLSEVLATDLKALRQLLRLPDRLARVRAAGRVLTLVR
jgi:HEAT repeat protein